MPGEVLVRLPNIDNIWHEKEMMTERIEVRSTLLQDICFAEIE
jgi:hypothetical protein